MLQVENVSVTLETTEILHEIQMNVKENEIIGLIGPNGSGKSTLLRSIYRVLKPDAGLITLNDDDIYTLSPREKAQKMAVVRQENNVGFDFNVRDIVMMGRIPHKSLFESDKQIDYQIINEALSRVGMDTYVDRNFQTLSGGEKQRVLIARALAQEAQFLVLDEPTNHLDIRYQLEIMELVQDLKITIITALHDLNLAAAYCDRLYVLNSGKVAASGRPETVLRPEIINEVFGVEVSLTQHPVTKRPHLMFFASKSGRYDTQ